MKPVSALFLLTSVLGIAQTPGMHKAKTQDMLVYPGGASASEEWVYLPFSPLDPAVVHAGKRTEEVKRPSGAGSGTSVRFGELWGVGDKVEEGKEHMLLYHRPLTPAEGPWISAGEVQTDHGMPAFLVPLDRKDYFLGAAWVLGFADKESASFVALFHKSGDQILFDACVAMPYRDTKNIGRPVPLKPILPGDPAGQKQGAVVCEIEPKALHPNLWFPAQVQDHLVLASTQAGVIWVFSLKDGRLERSIDLANLSLEDLGKVGYLDHFILGVMPTPENQLVVVTRNVGLLDQAISHYRKDPGKEVQEEGKGQFIEAASLQSGLFWWEVDPESGKSRSLASRGDIPIRDMDYLHQSKYRFLVGPNGQILSNINGNWRDVLEKFGVPKAQPKKGEAAPSSSGAKSKAEPEQAAPKK